MMVLNDLHRRANALLHGLRISRRAIGRFRSDEKGQAIVESAVMISVLTLFGVSVLWFALAIYNRILLEQAANQGAMSLRNYQNQNVTNPCSNALTAIQQATSLDSTQMTITYYENGTSVSGGTCVDNLTQGDSVGVTIQFPASLGPFFTGITLNASSTLQVQ